MRLYRRHFYYQECRPTGCGIQNKYNERFDFEKLLVALQNELHCFAYKLTADKDEAETCCRKQC